MGYGVEIWGWKERERVEKLEERYLRCVMGLNSRTPGYMVREKLQRRKSKRRARKWAWRFEKRLGEGRKEELARNCLEEIKERVAKRIEILS